ncbi:MAG: hypothetical protein MZV70_71050 [Desulfobacterales bacterium]|nr:hypothetical protein [Desulfobacterales bacterium]
MIPIGRGQRELIIGDRQTGKTAIVVDTIINQKGNGRRLHLRRHRPEAARPSPQVVKTLEEFGAHGLHHRRRRHAPPTRRRSSTSRPTPAAPWASTSATTAGTPWCIYDDLSKHAAAYREISLLLRRPPGREAYPGDVFYLHSPPARAGGQAQRRARRRLADGPARSSRPRPATSPAYIPTNVISITDGQIFLESDLFNAGVRPGHQRRHLGLARRRQRPDQGHEAGRRHAHASTSPSTASWPPSPSSAPTSTRPPRPSSTAASG